MKEEKTMIVSGSHMMIMMVRQKINVVKQGEYKSAKCAEMELILYSNVIDCQDCI